MPSRIPYLRPLRAAVALFMGLMVVVVWGLSSPAASAASKHVLAGICPNPLLIQTSWFPEVTKLGSYAIVGPHGKIDTTHGIYYGTVGGVTVQVASGGPYQGTETDIGELYLNPSVFMVDATTTTQIVDYAQHPTVAVMAPLQYSALGMIYDPAVYHFKSVRTIGKSGAKILKAGETANSDLLTVDGVIKSTQWTYAYDGAPAQFVATGGKDVISDFIDEAPYAYDHYTAWKGKPKLAYLPLSKSGYLNTYGTSLVVRPSTVKKYSACLDKLVPMMQRAVVKFLKNPKPLSTALIKEANALKTLSPITRGLNNFTIKTLKKYKMLANGPHGVYGSFTKARVEKLINQLGPVAKFERVKLKVGLKASQLFTNKFLDKKIRLAGTRSAPAAKVHERD